MNTIIAIMMLLTHGMDAPKVVQKPVASYEECLTEVGKMLAVVKAHGDQEAKVMVGCEIDNKKSDPS